MTGSKALYVTYDGLTDPLGRSQVLPYLTKLAQRGHRITILSCEKPDREAKDGARIRAICDEAGLQWKPIRYHKKPPVLSSAYDATMLQRVAARLHKLEQFDLVHCRSYIPAIAGLQLKRRYGVRFLFDMRGFWAEEKAEGGDWPQSNPVFRSVFRYFKKLESQFLSEADAVVSLTHEAARDLAARPAFSGTGERISVIPCCVDFDHFQLADEETRRASREALGIDPEAKVLVYVGSLGGNYMLNEILDFYEVYRQGHAKTAILFVTQDAEDPIRAAAAEKGIDPASLVIRKASREEVPFMVSAADLGLAFKQPVYSSKACSPTKLGEMLALGVPVVGNAGVGDVGEILEEIKGGATVQFFEPDSYRRALSDLACIEGNRGEIRDRARKLFDVETGVGLYDAIYRKLGSAPPTESRG